MFKNLTRFRLLDFFELTAAIAGALYIWKYAGWTEQEKAWVLAAATVAGLSIWIATRIGKTAPSPGLFLAAYGAALYGMSDVTPWFVLLGNDRVDQFEQWMFPRELEWLGIPGDKVWPKPLRIGLIIAGLMIVPAVLVACAWSSFGTLARVMRKTPDRPNSRFEWAAFSLRSAVGLALIAFLLAAALRPQFQLVRTIRIPYRFELFLAEKNINLPPSSICAWTLIENDRVLILRDDRLLLELDLASGQVCRCVELQCESLEPSRNLLFDDSGFAGEPAPFGSNDPPRQIDQQVRIALISNSQIRVVRCDGLADSATVRLFDLRSGTPCESPHRGFLDNEQVVAISHNGRFLATQVALGFDKIKPVYRVWDLDDRAQVNVVELSTTEGRRGAVAVSDTGEEIITVPHDPRYIPMLMRRWETDRRKLVRLNPILSHDAKWAIYDGRRLKLTDAGEDRFLHPSVYRNNVMTFEPARSNLIEMPAANWLLKYDLWETWIDFGEKPIVDHLLVSAKHRQIVHSNLSTGASTSTFLNNSTLQSPRIRRPNLNSAKFTSDGKFMIVPDEDESADLFHIFSMP